MSIGSAASLCERARGEADLSRGGAGSISGPACRRKPTTADGPHAGTEHFRVVLLEPGVPSHRLLELKRRTLTAGYQQLEVGRLLDIAELVKNRLSVLRPVLPISRHHREDERVQPRRNVLAQLGWRYCPGCDVAVRRSGEGEQFIQHGAESIEVRRDNRDWRLSAVRGQRSLRASAAGHRNPSLPRPR